MGQEKRQPSLLFSLESLESLKDRIESNTWLSDAWDRKVAGLDASLDEPVKLPDRGGGWWHWYASPNTGARLRTGDEIGEWSWEHIDPLTDKVYVSDPGDPSRDYDRCVLMGVHDRLAKAARDMGVAYQVTGDVRYADRATEILNAYADRYPDYDLHTVRNESKLGGGKVGPQTLDESVWLIPFSQGADLVWDRLSGDDLEILTNRLLVPAVREVILPHELRVHNIQCWKNSAVGCVGFLIGDDELVAQAIEHPDRGFRKQIADGVMDDGAWWEGAWGYHFYTMSSLWALLEVARNNGIDLYDAKIKSMFDAPLDFAMPNLSLPAFNDSNEVDLAGRASIYELGYARYGNDRYVELLASTQRDDDFAIFFGEAELPQVKPSDGISRNFPASGYGILSEGADETASWLCLKYGPHGGGHGHPDKLSFVLYAAGGVIGLDPGSAPYGMPEHGGWYKTTFSHNTLVVDGQSQAASEGACLAFDRSNGIDYAIGDAGPIYAGVSFRRTVFNPDEGLFVFVDTVVCDRERQLDLVYHHRGKWSDPLEGETWTPPDEVGYRYLKEASSRKLTTGCVLSVKDANSDSTVTLGAGSETEVVTATGVGDHLEDRVPTVLFRRQAKATTYHWAVAVGDGCEVEPLAIQGSAEGCRVSRNDRSWVVVSNPEREDVELPGSTDRIIEAGYCAETIA